MTPRIKRARTKKLNAFYELTNHVGSIPSGIYRLSRRRNGFLEFEIGSKIFFSISTFHLPKLTRIPRGSAKGKLTGEADFVSRYYGLMGTRSLTSESDEPIFSTICCIDAGLALREGGEKARMLFEGTPDDLSAVLAPMSVAHTPGTLD